MWYVEIDLFKEKSIVASQKELERKLNNFDFSCGAITSDLDLPDELKESDVHFRDLRCKDPVKKLYYSMGFEQICIYCSTEDDLDIRENFYPICASCLSTKEPISQR